MSNTGLMLARPDLPITGASSPSRSLNTAAPYTVSGNTATYGGGSYGPNDPNDPIISIKVGGATQDNGGQDSVTITQTPGGPSSIVIFHNVVQLGAATFSFTSSRGTGGTSLAIPRKIHTLDYDTSTFDYAINGSRALYVTGDMTSAAMKAEVSSGMDR